MIASNVNFNLYKSFVAVYDQKNISKAAAQLQITQPTVTYNVKELERQLGIKLFHTHPRGVEPTKDANELYKYVVAGLISIANGENAIRTFDESATVVLRVASFGGFVANYVARAVARFTKKYPLTKFEVLYSSYGDPLTRLSQHGADVVIDMYESSLPQLASIELKKIERVAVATADFIKENKVGDKITAESLETLPYIIFKKGQKMLDSRVKATAFATVETPSNLLALVKESAGIGICYADDLEGTSDLVTLDTSRLALPTSVLKCIYNKESVTKPTKAFVTELCEVFGVQSPFNK